MDIAEFSFKKRELEADISNVVSSLVIKFCEETTLCPSEVHIPMINITKLGSEKSEYIVGKCKVKIEL